MTVAETHGVPAPPWTPDLYTVEKALRLRTNYVALTCLLPGRDGTLYVDACRVFLLPSEVDEALAWVNSHAGPAATLTWTVATLTPDGAERINTSAKATGVQKTDVAGYDWVAADLDPDDVVPLKVYRQRLADFAVVPSLVLASGRGLHVFWRLDQWTIAADVVPVLKDLVRAFDSDAGTEQLTRNLRLPGTWNPKADAKRLAVVENHAPDASYTPQELSDRACAISPRPVIVDTPRTRRVLAGGDDWPDRYRAAYDLTDELTRVTGISGGARSKWPCPAHGPGNDGRQVIVHRDNPTRAVCFGGNHPDDMGHRTSDGLHTFDALDLHAMEMGQSVKDFMADERRARKTTDAGTPADQVPRQRPAGDDAEQGEQPSGQGQSAPSEQGSERQERKAPTTGEKLLRLALDRYAFGQSEGGELYATPNDRPHLARLLRGQGNSLRAELAQAFSESEGKAPSQSALAETMTVLEGTAMLAERRPLALRCAETKTDDGATRIVIDLGREDGQCVAVTPAGWEVTTEPGVLFRRSRLTGEMPLPVRGGGSLSEHMRPLLNVTDDSWPLLVAWMVAALLPDIPHPIALMTGEQGTGKTNAGKMLVQLLDPSDAPLRSAPGGERDWVVAASSSYVVGVDNISTIQPWFSDSLCKASTGDGMVTRALYSDAEVSVVAFRRVVLLTSIDAGALRGDLSDRLLKVELERIDPTKRRSERALWEAWDAARPGILGALLDLLVQVLAELPAVRLTLATRSRMADFSEVLAALDRATGQHTADLYEQAREQLASDVLHGDPVASAVLDLLAKDHGYAGTAAQLLKALQPFAPDPRPRDWPLDATRLAGAIKRVTPALRDQGVTVEDKRTAAGRHFTLAWSKPPSPPSGGEQAGTSAKGDWS